MQLVVVGSSWGGIDALSVILKTLPVTWSLPIAVGLHRRADTTSDALVNLLQGRTELKVVEPSDKDPLEARTVYIAPPDYHLLVEPGYFALTLESEIHFARPSIDVLFESAADSYRASCIGVLLTGANRDGAQGLRRIRDVGGITIVQDPATAARSEMPLAAIAAEAATRVIPLEKIGPWLGSVDSV
jgi:two-component system chemotaxis response regulator CheB